MVNGTTCAVDAGGERTALEAHVHEFTLRALGAYRAAGHARRQGDHETATAAGIVASEYLDRARIALAMIADLTE